MNAPVWFLWRHSETVCVFSTTSVTVVVVVVIIIIAATIATGFVIGARRAAGVVEF